MLGEITLDLALFTDYKTALLAAVVVLGAGFLAVFGATQVFPLIAGWIGRAFRAARGRA